MDLPKIGEIIYVSKPAWSMVGGKVLKVTEWFMGLVVERRTELEFISFFDFTKDYALDGDLSPSLGRDVVTVALGTISRSPTPIFLGKWGTQILDASSKNWQREPPDAGVVSS